MCLGQGSGRCALWLTPTGTEGLLVPWKNWYAVRENSVKQSTCNGALPKNAGANQRCARRKTTRKNEHCVKTRYLDENFLSRSFSRSVSYVLGRGWIAGVLCHSRDSPFLASVWLSFRFSFFCQACLSLFDSFLWTFWKFSLALYRCAKRFRVSLNLIWTTETI